MSLFEWLGESSNPGPVGSVDLKSPHEGRLNRWAVILCFLLAVAALGIWFAWLWQGWQVQSARGLGLAATLTFLYLLIAYYVHPKPDMDNVGWLGGLIDHPFRYSDDLNRFLIFLAIVLWPGRMLALGLTSPLHLLAQENRDTREAQDEGAVDQQFEDIQKAVSWEQRNQDEHRGE